jgi:hypothetical protein
VEGEREAGPARTGATRVLREVPRPEAEPIDLLRTAGRPVLVRLGALVLAAAGLVALVIIFRRLR